MLLPILNTLFIGILGIIASFIAAKIYSSTKMISVLIMGCGILAFALGAISSGWLHYLPDGMKKVQSALAGHWFLATG